MKIAEKNLKVSVCVVVYNQEKYVRQCLQSIVDQETNFDFEVIVADDCSTDGTRAIVQEFVNKYPTIVKPIFHEKNVGPYTNFRLVHEQATGEYISHMDGDDYALPGKLQIQADYLDQHSECNIVWHRMHVMNDATGLIVDDLIDLENFPRSGFTRADILQLGAIGLNSSKMYRSTIRHFDPPEFPIMDFFMNVEQVGTGLANFVGNKPLGVYRAGIGIASSGNTTRILMQKSFLFFAEKYPQYKREISAAALVCFLADLKNRRWSSCTLYAAVLAKTFRLGALLDIWRNRKIIPMLRIPDSIRRGVR